MEKIVLTDGESFTVVLAKGKATIDSDGKMVVDAGTSGYTRHLFDVEVDSGNCQNSLGQSLNSYNPTPYQPTKAEKIQQYLYMLYEAQKADHNVHTEIEDALKAFKLELGI